MFHYQKIKQKTTFFLIHFSHLVISKNIRITTYQTPPFPREGSTYLAVSRSTRHTPGRNHPTHQQLPFSCTYVLEVEVAVHFSATGPFFSRSFE